MRSHYVLAGLLGAGLALMSSLPSPADEAPGKDKIDKLIEQLGSGNFAEREKASKELAAIGMPALEALRKAAKNEDAEIRKRAEDILPKIERQAESVRVLTPKRVNLTYKDTPLSEALDDFQKKSGYKIQLHDPDGKLKERKITLDTGETTFWHAIALLCDKAELSEANMEDLMRVPQPPGGGPGAPAAGPILGAFGKGMPGRPGMFGVTGQLFLKDGKAKALPSDDRSAVRIRAVGKPAAVAFGNVPEGEILLSLDVTLEPKLQWQYCQSVHIETAVDDQDQKLSQVIPQVEGVVGIGAGNPAIQVQGGAGGAVQFQRMQRIAQQRMMWGGLSQQVPVQLKKGTKEAKSLKELKGVLTAHLLTEARPVITADKLDKAAGKSFKGEEGGEIKIVNVKVEESQTTIELQFEQPPYDKVVPAQPNGLNGVAFIRGAMPQAVKIPIQPALPAPPKEAKKPPPAPPPQEKKDEQPPARQRPVPPPPPPPPPAPQLAQIQIGGAAFGGPAQLMDSMNGLGIQDDKGNTLPIDGGRSRASISFVQQGNGPGKQTMTWTLVCPHSKDKDKPTKVVFLGRKLVTVEVPFTLKDVPLP